MVGLNLFNRLNMTLVDTAFKIRRVQEMVPTITSTLADLHALAFPGFFLTSLGRTFLCQLYAGFISDPEGICMVAEENGAIIGLAAGTIAPWSFFRKQVRRKWFSFALASVPGLLRNFPFAARKCLGALFYRGETPGDIPDAALLSSLAVLPATRSKGVGQALVRAFADEVHQRGCKAIYLATDEAENENANRFYAKCGFKLLDTFKRPGHRTMNRWIMRLT
jgi:ribosomal protein S18 acetylase RimI-like enzyme